MRGRRSIAAVIALAVLLAGGCSDDAESTDPTEQSESGAEATNDGAESTNDGSEAADDGAESNVDLSGIAVPLPPGADGVITTESGPATVVLFNVPLDQREATIAFYDEWTQSQSDAYQRAGAEADDGGVSWQNAPETGADRTIIAVLAPLEGDDFVECTLTVGPAE